MATALDIITSALRRISSYQPGETISNPDTEDCLEALNDLLDSWSTDKLQIYGTNEYILQWQVGKFQYKVGNPTCTSIGEPPFTGTVTGGSAVITGVTNIPADLVAGATLTDVANVIPANTTVLSFNSGAQTVTMSAKASATPSSNPDSITYTIPGRFRDCATSEDHRRVHPHQRARLLAGCLFLTGRIQRHSLQIPARPVARYWLVQPTDALWTAERLSIAWAERGVSSFHGYDP